MGNFSRAFFIFCFSAMFLGAQSITTKVVGGKIVGGVPAEIREFPYSISIRSNEIGHMCGGAIVSPNLVITAAACTDPVTPAIDEIVAGSLYRIEPYPGQQVRKPARIVPHPKYVWPPYDDISLIFLDQPFDFNENVSAIALPEANRTTFPGEVVINGWGAEQYGLPLSDILLKVTTSTYSDAICQVVMNQTVPTELLCTGTNDGGHTGCIGDAGAPIVNLRVDQPYLAAVLSHFGCTGPCCGLPGPNNHNPEVAYYIDWIEEQINLYENSR